MDVENDFNIDAQSFIENLMNESKFKKMYLVKKILSPIVVIPLSIVIGNIIRIFIIKRLEDVYGFYQMQTVQNYITILLFVICAYSIFIFFRKTFQIQEYLEKTIFEHIKNTYQITEISNDDKVIKNQMDSYINMINRNFKYQIKNAFNINSPDNRFFDLWLYHPGRPSTKGGAGADTIFNGVSVIIPTNSESLSLFYKTNDYMKNQLAYDSFNNAIPTNTITGELKEDIDKVHFKYGKPFKIVTVNENVQIFSEQTLSVFGSKTKIRACIAEYFKSIESIMEVTQTIEKYL